MKAYLSDSRTVSAFELLAGAAIVIGHNVFKVVPNEVPILFVLGLASVKLRNGGLAAMGFRGPTSWKRTLAIALAAAALRIVLSAVVIDPLTSHFWPPATAPEGSGDISGNPVEALRWLLLVWTFAAFGEEIGYRGYLMTRAADLGRQSTVAWLAALAVSAVLFGYGHYYKGPSGILDSGVAGLILGGAYLLSGRVLWTSILAHGFIDTFGVMALYFGWES
jgi:membrane protease YdiL (CAAX protease family)